MLCSKKTLKISEFFEFASDENVSILIFCHDLFIPCSGISGEKLCEKSEFVSKSANRIDLAIWRHVMNSIRICLK